jgi:hypothetical protein
MSTVCFCQDPDEAAVLYEMLLGNPQLLYAATDVLLLYIAPNGVVHPWPASGVPIRKVTLM